MTPLPPPLGSGNLVLWRLDQARFASTWNTGEGSYRFGGRWNSRGRHVVYAALDPATAILEVAVHKGFAALDTVPHVLTSALIVDHEAIRVVVPAEVPNANWLKPAAPSAGQQAFGDALLSANAVMLIPSVVSPRSWNVVLDVSSGGAAFRDWAQEPFALDPRLHPPAA